MEVFSKGRREKSNEHSSSESTGPSERNSLHGSYSMDAVARMDTADKHFFKLKPANPLENRQDTILTSQ